jgi:hypothetical protein
LQQACRQGAALQRKVLEVLVLMLRNDLVHEHPQISRQAYRWGGQLPALAQSRVCACGTSRLMRA